MVSKISCASTPFVSNPFLLFRTVAWNGMLARKAFWAGEIAFWRHLSQDCGASHTDVGTSFTAFSAHPTPFVSVPSQ